MFNKLFQSRWHRKARRASTTRGRVRDVRRTLESLENRSLMAVDAFVQQGTLYVYGTPGNDQIQVVFDAGKISIPGATLRNEWGDNVSSLNRSEVPYQVIMVGDAGDDHLEIVERSDRALPAIMYGMQGDDVLIGGSADDVLVGQEGYDYIDGRSGNDRLIGALYGDDRDAPQSSARNETLIGGEGDDTIYGSAGRDYIYGGAGNDLVRAGQGDDVILGGAGDDRLVGELGNDTIYGEDGNDWLVGCVDGDGRETGRDKIYGGNGDDTLWGGAGDDRLVGELGNDTIYGEDGNDWLVGCIDGDGRETGRDTIYGGNGDDTLWGGAGDDYLAGEKGRDSIFGEWGNDILYGGEGNDRLNGQQGADMVNGGSGYDAASVDSRSDRLYGAETVSIENIPGGSPQTDNWSCGPNSASRFLQWNGVSVSYDQMRALVRQDGDLISRVGLGTRPSTLLDAMRRMRPATVLESKVDVAYGSGGLERVLSILGSGKPLLALINVGGYSSVPLLGTVPSALHWITLTGFNRAQQTISYMNTNGVAGSMSFGDFYNQWNWSSSGAIGASLTGTLGVGERTIIF